MKYLKMVLFSYSIFAGIIFLAGLGAVPKGMAWYECSSCYMDYVKIFKGSLTLPLIFALYRYYQDRKKE